MSWETRDYRVVRMYFNAGIRKRIIEDRLTEAEAQAHCRDPESSSASCKGKAGKARTRKVGPWFDGYERY